MYTVMRVHDFDAAEHLPAVLLDRLWPRGVRKERLEGTVWEKAATPSTALRVWFHEDREGRFDEFCRRLRQELPSPRRNRRWIVSVRWKSSMARSIC